MFSRETAVSGTLLLPAVLFGVAPANADIGITTQNVRYTLGPAHARHDIRQAAARGSVLFTQEMGHRYARRFRPAGWSVAHAGAGRRGDCATFYSRDVWRLRRAWPVGIGAGRYALVSVLTGRQTLAAVCVHMPTIRSGERTRALRGLRPLLARLSARYPRVVVGGDWNRDYARRAAFPGYRAARPPAATFSGRRIDYVYARTPAHIARVRVIRHTYSDHNGVRVWVGMGRHG